MTKSRYYSKTGCNGMGTCYEKKTTVDQTGPAEKDCQAHKLNEEDATDHSRWTWREVAE